MKKLSPLFLALSLSAGLNLSLSPLAHATLPVKVEGQQLPSLAPMLSRVLPAVVSVQVSGIQAPASDQNTPQPLKKFPGQPSPQSTQPQPFEGLGSGVIINAEKGYILTNHHVIRDATKITVQLSDGRQFDAKVLGSDTPTDIALLQVKNPKDLTQISVANSDQLQVGDFAVAIGNPFGLGQTATSGIISALGRSGLNIEGLENFIQTDAAINRGNSGGALVNLRGELIGINTAILASNGGNIGIGFAIPGNMAMNIADQLIKYGQVKHGQLGIKGTELTPEMAKAFNVNVSRGAFIAEVLPGSAAAKAGLKAGDIITTLDDKSLSGFAELRVKVSTHSPGDKLRLGILRAGKPLAIVVTLEQSGANVSAVTRLADPAFQGATFTDGETVSKEKGIKVAEVIQQSPAAQVGMHPGDVIISVNRQRVQNLAELHNVLETKPDVIALNVIRGQESIYLLMR